MQWQDHRDHPPSWALKFCFLNTSFPAVPWTEEIVYAGRKQTDNPKFLCQAPFSSSYFFFFHTLPFMSCHNEKQWGRSDYQWVLKSHYDSKSRRQEWLCHLCNLQLEKGGWVDTVAAQDTWFPSASSACDLRAAGNCFLNERQINGNIWQSLV